MTGRTIAKTLAKQKYFVIATVGFILWISETAYFGFNARPENNIEKTLDILSGLLIGWGIIGDILKGVEIHKKSNTVFNETHNITTKEVVMQGEKPVVHYHFGTTEKQTRDLLKGRKNENN